MSSTSEYGCDHRTTEGCYRCCGYCSHDAHRCGGCGAPLEHSDGSCCDDCQPLMQARP